MAKNKRSTGPNYKWLAILGGLSVLVIGIIFGIVSLRPDAGKSNPTPVSIAPTSVQTETATSPDETTTSFNGATPTLTTSPATVLNPVTTPLSSPAALVPTYQPYKDLPTSVAAIDLDLRYPGSTNLDTGDALVMPGSTRAALGINDDFQKVLAYYKQKFATRGYSVTDTSVKYCDGSSCDGVAAFSLTKDAEQASLTIYSSRAWRERDVSFNNSGQKPAINQTLALYNIRPLPPPTPAVTPLNSSTDLDYPGATRLNYTEQQFFPNQRPTQLTAAVVGALASNDAYAKIVDFYSQRLKAANYFVNNEPYDDGFNVISGDSDKSGIVVVVLSPQSRQKQYNFGQYVNYPYLFAQTNPNQNLIVYLAVAKPTDRYSVFFNDYIPRIPLPKANDDTFFGPDGTFHGLGLQNSGIERLVSVGPSAPVKLVNGLTFQVDWLISDNYYLEIGATLSGSQADSYTQTNNPVIVGDGKGDKHQLKLMDRYDNRTPDGQPARHWTWYLQDANAQLHTGTRQATFDFNAALPFALPGSPLTLQLKPIDAAMLAAPLIFSSFTAKGAKANGINVFVSYGYVGPDRTVLALHLNPHQYLNAHGFNPGYSSLPAFQPLPPQFKTPSPIYLGGYSVTFDPLVLAAATPDSSQPISGTVVSVTTNNGQVLAPLLGLQPNPRFNPLNQIAGDEEDLLTLTTLPPGTKSLALEIAAIPVHLKLDSSKPIPANTSLNINLADLLKAGLVNPNLTLVLADFQIQVIGVQARLDPATQNVELAVKYTASLPSTAPFSDGITLNSVAFGCTDCSLGSNTQPGEYHLNFKYDPAQPNLSIVLNQVNYTLPGPWHLMLPIPVKP